MGNLHSQESKAQTNQSRVLSRLKSTIQPSNVRNLFAFKNDLGKKSGGTVGNFRSPDARFVISVELIQARKLPAKDITFTSDPFVQLKVGDLTARSCVKKKTTSPVWNERIEIIIEESHLNSPGPPQELEILVYDWDKISKNDLIGTTKVIIPVECWKQSGIHGEYKWYPLKSASGKEAGEVELCVDIKPINTSQDRRSKKKTLSQIQHHISFFDEDVYYFSITHFLRVTVKGAKNLSRKDLLTKNNSIAKVSFGSQSFETSISLGSSPSWNQSTWLFLSESYNKNYQLLVQVYDKDTISAPDHIGAVYIPANYLLDLNERHEDWYSLKDFIANSDAALVKPDSFNEGVETGQVLLEFELVRKSNVEKNIFLELLRLVNINSINEDEPKFESNEKYISRAEFDAVLLMIEPHLSTEDLEDIFSFLDLNKDGRIGEKEALRLLSSQRFHFSGLSRKLLSLLHNANGIESPFLSDIANDEMNLIKKKTADIIVKDRETGLEVKENLPVYLKVALKMMFSNVIGRSVTSRTVAVLQRMSAMQGRKFDSPESVSEIQSFCRLHNLDPNEFDKPIEEYKNFNDFFSRGLKDIDSMRPMSGKSDDKIAVCPADCRLMVFPHILDASKYWIKGDRFTLEELLGPEAGSKYAQWFKGGSLAISRLAPQDYHRWHCPVEGIFREFYDIPGALYTVNPIAINQNMNVYTENKRRVCMIDTKTFGTIALIAVAATMVGAMEIFGEPGTRCKKGEVHGKFLFGGSTVLLLFQPNSITFSQDLILNSIRLDGRAPIETLVKVRSILGTAKIPGKKIQAF